MCVCNRTKGDRKRCCLGRTTRESALFGLGKKRLDKNTAALRRNEHNLYQRTSCGARSTRTRYVPRASDALRHAIL
jgi:hypothetical protein